MRPLLLLSLLTFVACKSGDDGGDTDTDATSDDSDSTDGSDDDTDDDGSDDTDDGGSDDTDEDFPPPGEDFTSNGPGAGYHWFLEPAPVDAPNTRCGVGSARSMNFYADTWQVQSPSTSLMQFAIALQATPGGSMVCDYELDGTFTCSTTTTVQNLSQLEPPYNLDATVSMSTTASGRFRARTADDPSTDADHDYTARWAADLNITFSVTCTGTQCSSAAGGMGSAGFPCTSTFTRLGSVNYSDPTLELPEM